MLKTECYDDKSKDHWVCTIKFVSVSYMVNLSFIKISRNTVALKNVWNTLAIL